MNTAFSVFFFLHQMIFIGWCQGYQSWNHGNVYHHYTRAQNTLQGEAWLKNYCDSYSEPMPHADIFHLHVPTKKSVFNEKPEYVKIKDSSLFKFWDHKVKVPKKGESIKHGPPQWTLSMNRVHQNMDRVHGPPNHGPGPWTPHFYKLRLHHKLRFDDL